MSFPLKNEPGAEIETGQLFYKGNTQGAARVFNRL
jgi:hypothetical protein